MAVPRNAMEHRVAGGAQELTDAMRAAGPRRCGRDRQFAPVRFFFPEGLPGAAMLIGDDRVSKSGTQTLALQRDASPLG
ncbi:MAG: hypothetical protein JO122_21415 [Acetobacteraceae bacterium]|nr:hypothetical protein [Acetobacteraceae bacterium]